MATPIVKATKGKTVMSFYTQFEYEEWKKTSGPGWKVKYYKGLGTSTRDEAKEYFGKLNIMPYSYTGPQSDSSIDLAFNKSKADDRKDWLKTYARENILTPQPALPYEDFVDKDLIHFSNYNLERSIPNIMDGLKTSQRKILYSALKRNLKSELRVAQFAGYVSEHSGYHHGEASLNDAIVGMAQDFMGSNNMSWFVPQGQFGTRLQGGSDAASPRYIHTYLQPHVSKLVPDEDFASLTYRDDDGMLVEPEWYAPILPMILVNGSRGIGTGYSTFLPSYNPSDLKKMLLAWLETGEGLDAPLVPWVRGFQGKMTMEDAKSCLIEGKHTMDKDMLTITELPVGMWTADVRETLDKMLTEGTIKDFTDTSTDVQVCIKIKMGSDTSVCDKLLKSKWKLTNMHAFNSKCAIQKYDTPNDILKEYAGVRLDLYAKRREQMLKELRDTLPFHENVVRFIRQQSQDSPVPDLRRKTREECDSMLSKEKFAKIKDGYDYLMNLPIASLTLTNARKHETALENLVKMISELEGKTSKKMWKDELTALSI
jgi:DNA topoisomerase-2